MFNGRQVVSAKLERSSILTLIGVGTLLWVVLVMTLASAAQETPAEPEAKPADPGLTEILPVEPPDGLGYEDFSILDGNWVAWGEQAAEEVGQFYMAEDQTAAQQRVALASLRKRLKTMENSLADRRFRSLWGPITTIHGRLVRRVDLAEAMLDTLELTPEKVRKTRLEAAGAGVTGALRSLERRLQSITGGTAWLPYVKADEITKLMKTPADSEQALPLLTKVHSSLTDLESKGKAQREFLSGREFTALATAIGTYVQRAEEVQPPLDVEKLRSELARLVESVEKYEENGRQEDVKNVGAAIAAIGKITPDSGAQIRSVIETYYQNDNLRVVASEEFLSRYIRDTHTESSPIGEYIGGSYVSGSQTTTASTGIDLLKSERGALFDVTLSGVARSSTIARASRANARIWSSGNHRFTARRSVRFDGDKFTLGPRGIISVNANITTTGASTKYDGGMFAANARRKAYAAANARKGQSEQTAASKIRSRVLPKFERETTKEFTQANKDIQQQWNTKLKQAQLEPAGRKVYSTNKHLYWSSRVAREGEFSGGAIATTPPPKKGLTIHAHATFLNAMFARMDIAGRTMTDVQFRKVVDDYFAILLGNDEDPATAKPSEKEADSSLYVFAKVDPIRFQIENDTLFLVIRTGIRQEGKDEIPTQRITVPLTFRLADNDILIERGSVRVSPMERPKSRAEQIVRARVMGAKIEKDLGNRTRSRTMNLSRGEGKKDLVIKVQQITALNGWITIQAE